MKAVGVMLSIIGGFIVLGAITVVYIYNSTPVPTEAMAATNFQESSVYADDGTLIGHLGDTDRQTINYDQIPPKIIWAVLAAEDRNFFNEGAISPTGIMRAAYEDVMNSGNLQGGSTITQEFVRNYYTGIGTAQTASRKIKEIFVAMKVGRTESKQWILENYLNTIYLGQGSYGIAAAAQTYFDIPVSKLSTITWSQAALLAAVIQQPSTYPLPQFLSNFKGRWDYVIQGLVTTGHLTPQFAATLTFPKFGDHIPQSYGSAVWDPYVLNVVQNELEDVDGLTQSEIFNGGYKIITTVDPAKMNALYQSVSAQEAAMTQDGEGIQSYMHVGAVLENPNTGAIEAMYAGPGYPGARYNGTGRVITAKYCTEIDCEENLAVYAREQVGSSFKPYILSSAVAQGMNVQGSELDGEDNSCIPPDWMQSTDPVLEPDPAAPNGGCPTDWDAIQNDDPGGGAVSPQDAMTNSINTAYTDLWHKDGGANVLHMAAEFGVNLTLSGLDTMQDEAGVALGQASLTVGEQATMLAAIDNGGTYHTLHIIGQIDLGADQFSNHVTSHPVFSGISTTNQGMDSQVQYGMMKVAVDGTGTDAAMTDGREIISKTGTTNTSQSDYFIGAIPQEALAVAIFTNQQGKGAETLNGLGGISQAFGGDWPALIWHTYAESEFAQLTPEQFPQPTFSGTPWILVSKNMLTPPKKKDTHKQHTPTGVGVQPTVAPSPTVNCTGGVITVDCNSATTSPGAGGTGTDPTPSPSLGVAGNLDSPDTGGTQAGAVAGGAVVLLPATLFLVRRRERKRARRHG
jgi:membrane peptidoglycan carboxypeptidase